MYSVRCSSKWHLLNQIPNASSNTFLNNSKLSECRLILFKPWVDKCIRHSVFEFERSAWFHARAFVFFFFFFFCLMVPPLEKVTKKNAENYLFQFCFTLRKCFVFVFYRQLTALNGLKVLKLSTICLKNGQRNDAKNKRSEHFISQWRDTIQFTLESIKLLILINN